MINDYFVETAGPAGPKTLPRLQRADMRTAFLYHLVKKEVLYQILAVFSRKKEKKQPRASAKNLAYALDKRFNPR